MNLKVESLTDVQKTSLIAFLKKINYPKEELVFTILISSMSTVKLKIELFFKFT